MCRETNLASIVWSMLQLRNSAPAKSKRSAKTKVYGINISFGSRKSKAQEPSRAVGENNLDQRRNVQNNSSQNSSNFQRLLDNLLRAEKGLKTLGYKLFSSYGFTAHSFQAPGKQVQDGIYSGDNHNALQVTISKWNTWEHSLSRSFTTGNTHNLKLVHHF